MADLPPLSGWPNTVSPISNPDQPNRHKLRTLRSEGRKRHLRSLRDIIAEKKDVEGWHG